MGKWMNIPSVKGNGDAGPDDAGMLEWKGTKLWFSRAWNKESPTNCV